MSQSSDYVNCRGIKTSLKYPNISKLLPLRLPVSTLKSCISCAQKIILQQYLCILYTFEHDFSSGKCYKPFFILAYFDTLFLHLWIDSYWPTCSACFHLLAVTLLTILTTPIQYLVVRLSNGSVHFVNITCCHHLVKFLNLFRNYESLRKTFITW